MGHGLGVALISIWGQILHFIAALPLPTPTPPIVVITNNGSTAANQATAIAVAIIGATASITTACVTAYFAYLMVKVKRVTYATHTLVNHDRQVMLETQAQTLRAAVLDHPEDLQLREAWKRADEAATHARNANALPGSKVKL